MKRILTLLSGFVVVLFVLFVIRETTEVVKLAAVLHPAFGRAVLWALLLTYGACVAVPLVLFFRLPKPLRPPASETGEEFTKHLNRLAQRLARNPYLEGVQVTPTDRASIERALQLLHEQAKKRIVATASMVFLSTAVSQSGRLDALAVLIAQTRMVWQIAQVYSQRPSVREMTYLYSNLAGAVFVAQTLQDVDLTEVVTPVVGSVLAQATGGLALHPSVTGVAHLVADALLEGSVNAFLTLRVGCMASRYCGALILDPKRIRSSAITEAAQMLPGIVGELGGAVSSAIWKAAKRLTPGAALVAVLKKRMKTALSRGKSSETST